MSIKLKKILVFFLTILAVILIALTCVYGKQSEANAYNCDLFFSQELKTEYVIGESFTIPSAKLIYNDNEYDAEKVKIIFPSGVTFAKNSVILSEAGEYTLCYYKNIDGTLLQSKKTFNVINSIYSVGEKSTVIYGTDNRLSDSIEGLKVSLKNGEVFRYNVPLDLTGKTKRDAIINFIPLPASQGLADANVVYVKLTDAYDENNYILIKTWHADLSANGKTYFGRAYQSAGGSNQTLTGIQVVSSSSLIYRGEYYSKRVGTAQGFEANFSFTAVNGYGKDTYSLSMNYADREIYGCKQFNSYGGNLIIDLDEPLFFKDYWNGFTTGECYLSIYAEAYNTSEFNFLITDILDEDLSATAYESTIKPVLTVEELDDVYALVGKTFKILPALAVDVYSGVLDCDVKVFYNGYANVAVTDGRFTPTRAGRYTIVYTAKGLYGAITEKKITVEAFDEPKTQVDFETLPHDLKSGDLVQVNIPSVTGTSGDYTVKLYAKHTERAQVVYDLVLEDNKYCFVPLYSGEYSLYCDITDSNGTVTFERIFSVVAGNYCLKTEPDVPKYFIKNASYNLGQIVGYELSSGTPIEKPADIYYSFDGSNFVKADSSTLTVSEGNQVVIKCYCENVLVYEKAIPVIDVGYGTYEMNIAKYFVSTDESLVFDNDSSLAKDENGNPVLDKDGNPYLSFDYAGFVPQEENSEMEFIKEVFVDTFSFIFRVPETECNFKTLQIKLQSGDEILSVQITSESKSESVISINNKVSYVSTESFAKGGTCVLEYTNDTNALTVNRKVYLLTDDVFSGFSDIVANLSVGLYDVDQSAKSSFLIYKINNQTICAAQTDDYTAPELYQKIDSGLKQINDELTLKNIRAIDVLSLNCECKMTVVDPDGNYVVSKEGVELRNVDCNGVYTVKFDRYGGYKIILSYKDYMNNAGSKVVNVTVTDFDAPVIEIDNTVQEVKVGAAIKLRNYTVKDNVDDDENIKTFAIVIAPTGISYNFSDSFTVSQKGLYKVILCARDSWGNQSQVSYDVVVQ